MPCCTAVHHSQCFIHSIMECSNVTALSCLDCHTVFWTNPSQHTVVQIEYPPDFDTEVSQLRAQLTAYNKAMRPLKRVIRAEFDMYADEAEPHLNVIMALKQDSLVNLRHSDIFIHASKLWRACNLSVKKFKQKYSLSEYRALSHIGAGFSRHSPTHVMLQKFEIDL